MRRVVHRIRGDAEAVEGMRRVTREGVLRAVKIGGKWLTLLMILSCVIGGVAWVTSPSPARWLATRPEPSLLVLDRHDAPLRQLPNAQGSHHLWRPLHAHAPQLLAATRAAEDRRFFSHHGVDPWAILRSSWLNLRGGGVKSGASTITQQLVKLTWPDGGCPHGRWRCKLTGAWLALKLDRDVDKPTQLEHYLSRAPYGHARLGAEAASRLYFGRSSAELDWAHAAFLAGLTRAPSALDPYRDPSGARRVQRAILAKLLEQGALSRAEYEEALLTPITLSPLPTAAQVAQTQHVVEHLRRERPELHTYTTTLDAALQREVSQRLAHHVARMEARGVSQAAALVLETQRGEVLAHVGSRDYFDQPSLGANDGVLARRRPGSTLKPFLYLLYLEDGGTLADPIADLPALLRTSRGSWEPQNFDHRFHGPVPVREALASSLNVPAVLMAQALGVERLIALLRDLGVRLAHDAEEEYGAGLALGNAELSLLELARAYAALGRGGISRDLSYLQEDVARFAARERRRFSKESSALILDAMRDDMARRHGFGRHSALDLDPPVSSKTGTSTGYRDAWAVAVTPTHTIAVWAGNFDGSPMDRMSGASAAAPLLRELIFALQEHDALHFEASFPMPRTLVQREVCLVSGQDASSDCACERRRVEWFRGAERGAVAHLDARGRHAYAPDPSTSCPMHRRTPAGEQLAAPASWRAWADEEGIALAPQDTHATPQAWITHPADGERYRADPRHPEAHAIALAADVIAHDAPLWWWRDGRPFARAAPPYQHLWRPDSPGTYTLGIGSATAPLHQVTITVTP